MFSKGEKRDIQDLEDLSAVMKETSLCGLGQTAPNPVLSTLRYFRDEYDAHIYEKKCPAIDYPNFFIHCHTFFVPGHRHMFI